MISQLFGIPVYKTNISPVLYNKQEIISSIEKNFKLDPLRNYWDNKENYKSNLHHMSQDFDNDGFIPVPVDQLYPIYEKEITTFLKQLGMKSGFSYEQEICNYTCMQQGQFMKEHIHTSDFVGVHYIKFNNTVHKPTIFSNDNGYALYLASLIPNIRSKLDVEHVNNSWLSKYFNLETIEDNFVITPGIINHFVPPFDSSDELRMTIVVNIKIL
jgi:hypothetical protein